jgi:hypothetical protein
MKSAVLEGDQSGSGLWSTDRGAQVFQKPRRHLKILDTRIAAQSKHHTDDPEIFGATVPNLVARAT